MADDDFIVLCHHHIELERAHAHLRGQLEAGQGVFGQQGAGAAVALQVDQTLRLRAHHQQAQAQQADPGFQTLHAQLLQGGWAGEDTVYYHNTAAEIHLGSKKSCPQRLCQKVWTSP